MRIGELARRTGASERMLRYYEEQDLLRPARRPSGYREYQETDVRTVRKIRTLLAAGLNTVTIAEVLPCMIEKGEILVPVCGELAPVLVEDRDRISAAIDDLLAARHALDAMITAARRTGVQGDNCEAVPTETAGRRTREAEAEASRDFKSGDSPRDAQGESEENEHTLETGRQDEKSNVSAISVHDAVATSDDDAIHADPH